MTFDKNFEDALKFCLQWEGGNDDDPVDRGGRTSRGITQRVYNGYLTSLKKSTKDVWLATDNEVKDIYYNAYYLPTKCNEIAEFAPKLAIAVFDWSVNSGIAKGTKTLQTVVGSKQDGIMGAKTLNDVKAAIAKNGEDEIVNRYQHLRYAQYVKWGKGSQRRFLDGWLNRCNSLSKLLLS